MSSKILRKLSLMLGLSLLMVSGCVKSTCETNNDCPAGNVCSEGKCLKACAIDDDCPSGKFCDKATRLCATGCRDNSECPSDNMCVQHKCWPSSNDGGALGCSCLQAPHACLTDINPASATAGTSVCEPSDPPRATLLFFGNVGCSHCQNIFGQLLEIESELRSEGFDPTMAFVQLKGWDYTGEEVTSTLPKHHGPVLQDTDSVKMWDAYGADWYEVKIIDTHGCLSAFFASPDTMNLVSGGNLQTAGTQLKEAWIAAMGGECHVLVDAGLGTGSGP